MKGKYSANSYDSLSIDSSVTRSARNLDLDEARLTQKPLTESFERIWLDVSNNL